VAISEANISPCGKTRGTVRDDIRTQKIMITLFVDFQQDLYRIIRNLEQRLPKQNEGIRHCINLLKSLSWFWEDHYTSLQGQDMTDVIGEILRLQSTLSPLKDNSKELFGLANIVFEQKKMVMKNRIPVPKDYVRLYSPFTQDIYADVPLDAFCEVPVNTKGLIESNHFLVSLWNEMNINLHPSKSSYVPWAYSPRIISREKPKLILLGDVDSRIGNIHIILSLEGKQNIKSLLVYNNRMKKDDCQSLFESFVEQAKNNQNTLKRYACKVYLKSNVEGIAFSSYSGTNFFLSCDENGAYVDIRLNAIDIIEARQQLMARLDALCSFLAVETNLLFEVIAPLELTDEHEQLPVLSEMQYILPFIDGSAIRNDIIMLSKSAISYLERYIFVDRDIMHENERQKYFSRGCIHVYEGLKKHIERGEKFKFSSRMQNVSLAPKDTPGQQIIITMSAMSYLSAIETASIPEGSPETCPTCGNVTYKISNRVMNFMAKYLNKELGSLFKSFYAMRSQFLHSGKLSSESYQITSRPFIDPSTGSGLSDYGFITCRVNGELMGAGLQNIQEWTTYALRCYYQEHLFGVTDFETHEDESRDIDIKQMFIDKIKEVMPDGIEVLDIKLL
jgi:hypothetical protein